MRKDDDCFKNFKVSEGYFQSLQRRFHQLSVRKIKAFDRLRVSQVNKAIVDNFFEVLDQAFQTLREKTVQKK